MSYQSATPLGEPPCIKGVKRKRTIRPDRQVDYLLYHRKTMTRLPNDWTSPEFQKALAAAAKAKPKARTLRDLIREYQASPKWTKLKDVTKNVERYHIKCIDSEFGRMSLKSVEAKGSRAIFREWHADWAEKTPRGADMRLGRLQTILKFGIDRERIERNPVPSFERAYLQSFGAHLAPRAFRSFECVARKQADEIRCLSGPPHRATLR